MKHFVLVLQEKSKGEGCAPKRGFGKRPSRTSFVSASCQRSLQ